MIPTQLIFLISQPRSGSTLLQKVISNAPEIGTSSEPWILLPYLSVFRNDLVITSYRQDSTLVAINDYLDKHGLQDKLKKGLSQFLLSLYPNTEGQKYFLDKTPRYYEILDEIYAYFPQARFIVLKRHPFDALHSMVQTWSEGGFDPLLLRAFHRDFMEAPFRLHEFSQRMKNHPNVYTISYEDIVLSSEEEAERIFTWLDIPFDPEYLTVDNAKVTGIYGDDVYRERPRMKIDATGLGKWKSHMSNKQYRSFFLGYADFLGHDFLSSYGYPIEEESKKLRYKKDYFRDTMEKIGEYRS